MTRWHGMRRRLRRSISRVTGAVSALAVAPFRLLGHAAQMVAQLRSPVALGRAQGDLRFLQYSVWPRVYLVVVGILVVLTMGVLAKQAAAPGFGVWRGTALMPPGPVAVEGWELMTNRPVASPKARVRSAFWAQESVYRRGATVLQVQAWCVNEPEPDAAVLGEEVMGRKGQGSVRSIGGIGVHLLIEGEGGPWLGACLDRNGVATGTASQFREVRWMSDRTGPRLARAVVGLQPLYDTRTVWVGVEVAPTTLGAEVSAPAILESFWEGYARAIRSRLGDPTYE